LFVTPLYGSDYGEATEVLSQRRAPAGQQIICSTARKTTTSSLLVSPSLSTWPTLSMMVSVQTGNFGVEFRARGRRRVQRRHQGWYEQLAWNVAMAVPIATIHSVSNLE
jgi:hypothetical protein